MPHKNIVILGAGYGGLEAAKTLHKKLKDLDNVTIQLIDQNREHVLLTELHEVAGNRVNKDGVKVSIDHVLQYTKVEFIQDRITGADLKNKILYSKDRQYPFDYIILACGSEPAYFNIPGMKENAFSLWSLEDAVKIKNHIIEMFQLADKEQSREKRQQLLTFVVGGGGFTGVEMMGELIEWTATLCGEYNIPKSEVKLVLVEALSRILCVLNDKLVNKSVKYLKKKGVEILTDSPITNVEKDKVYINDEKVINTHTLIWTGGIQAKEFTKDLGLTLKARNRIEVNDRLQTKEFPYVYAIGDNCFLADDKGTAMPPLVEAALQSGECAAHNIAAEIKGGDKKSLKPNLHGVMISIGSWFAVANIMGMNMSGFLATIMKHLVNMHYLFGIGGFELIVDYINHQFINKERKYSFVVDHGISHIKVKTFTFWLSILRVFFGIMWLRSGLEKLHGGWLEVGDQLVSGASVMAGIGDAPGWYQNIFFNIIEPNALLFQHLVVITEIALGLAFIAGFFTVLAALVSIGMNINFYLTGGGDPWFLMTSIIMLGGAGRAFGLDYYIMPYLQRLVRNYGRNTRIKLKI